MSEKYGYSTIPQLTPGKVGIVFSGGGSRAAYQIGALRALGETGLIASDINVITGSSIGAVNGLIFAAALKNNICDTLSQIEELWRERTFKNTFYGHPSRAFLKAIQVTVLRYTSPRPGPTSLALFNPTPLKNRVNQVLGNFGGLVAERFNNPTLSAVGVMTTMEGAERKPLLFVTSKQTLNEDRLTGASFELAYTKQLTADHGFASAALPSVLPPVALDIEAGKVTVVDGGISDNIPVDPTLRLGAESIIILDASGRSWWLDRFGKPHDTRDEWEVLTRETSYCFCPDELLVLKNKEGLGLLLKQAVGRSTRDFIRSLGPMWPIFKILRYKMGEELSYEVMSYVALHPQYIDALLEKGYQDTIDSINVNSTHSIFHRNK